jgi:hypothetical protein
MTAPAASQPQAWLPPLPLSEPDGLVVGWLLADVPADAPDDVREGIARRQHAALHGRCTCGADQLFGDKRSRRHTLECCQPLGAPCCFHRPGCPGGDRALAEAIDRWRTGGAG